MPGRHPAQPLPATVYVLISAVGLIGAIIVGWFLITSPGLMSQNQAASRSYYFLLVILGLGTAAFLFGAMRSTATITGNQFGAVSEFGGPAAIAILVVIGGFYLIQSPQDFSLTLRLRAAEPIVDATETWARIDLGPRRDERVFSRDGEATFSAVPSRYLDEDLPIELISKTYRLMEQKHAYKIPPSGILYLDVSKAAVSEFQIEISGRVLISHLMGEPIVAFGMKGSNSASKPIELGDLSLDLTSPSGGRYSLITSMVTPNQRSVETAMPPASWKIYPGETLSNYLWWARIQWRNLGASQSQQIKQLPEYQSPTRWPCFNESTLSDSAAQIVQKDFESAFIWSRGTWMLKVSATANGRPISVSFAIDLSEGDVNGMKAVAPLYKNCQGINPASMFVSSGAAQTLVDKPRQDVMAIGAPVAQ